MMSKSSLGFSLGEYFTCEIWVDLCGSPLMISMVVAGSSFLVFVFTSAWLPFYAENTTTMIRDNGASIRGTR